MSEGDVSMIRDEDVLRRMWQQTEDFSRKKEIRAHMYRLREERLRDLYSPEPTLEGKDLKAMSNAGWNVESENKTTDDGHTHVKTVQANIEGRYDVEGGKGQFAAIDHHKQAVTEYQDENSSLKRNESSSNSAAHEEVVQKTDDGTHFSSTNSSSSTSKFQQVSSSTKSETVPYNTRKNYDNAHHIDNQTDSKEASHLVTKNTNYEQSLRRTECEQGELISRKVEYPDDNTKVVVETRCLPDGTKVTSTRKEFRQPVIQTSHSEHHSQESRRENKSYSTVQHSNVQKSSKSTQETNIVDSQKTKDAYDFVSNRQTDTNDITHTDSKQRKQNIIHKDEITDKTNNVFHSENITNIEDKGTQKKIYTETEKKNKENYRNDSQENVITHSTSTNKEDYQTTYKSDYSQKKISNDWSPTQQAWASSLRSDTPTTARSPTRATSPGSKTFGSSTSSLRSSVSPDKFSRKPSSRGSSPSKTDRSSPSRLHSDNRTSSQSTIIISNKSTTRQSPERPPIHPSRANNSPDRRSTPRSSVSPDKYSRMIDISEFDTTTSKSKKEETTSSDRKLKYETENTSDRHHYSRSSLSPEKGSITEKDSNPSSPLRRSPERKPGYMRSTVSSRQNTERSTTISSRSPSKSPDRKIYSALEDDHYKFIDEETKMYTRIDKDNHQYDSSIRSNKNKYVSPTRKSPTNDKQSPEQRHRSTEKDSRSPSPVKVTLTKGKVSRNTQDTVDKVENSVTSTVFNDTISQKNQISTKYENNNNKQYTTDDITVRGRKTTSPINSTPKSTPRNSSSPTKYMPNKNQIVTDFIAHEKTTSNINKIDHPRQLITPSASPTRKPQIEKAPSTISGQSSPTTSVSGFVYFSSQSPTRPVVTDLDDHEVNFSEKYVPKKPDTLNLKRSPSPSKIPCRSPSPEKQNMPRKSSLKKPSPDAGITSPSEKPPTSFRISPTVETSDHKIVKKDRADKYTDHSTYKVKPPFERRETYEERCRKILGMIDDTNSDKTSSQTTEIDIQDDDRSGSISPCHSPVENIQKLSEHIDVKSGQTTAENFIAHEKVLKNNTSKSKSTSTSRESSPTKLQDITRPTYKNVSNKSGQSTTEDFIHHERKVTESDTLKYKSRSTSRESSPTKLQDLIHLPTDKTIKKDSNDINNKKSINSSKKSTSTHSRTPSPTKSVSSQIISHHNITENTKTISSDKEAEILEKVQKTLRKLSPDRKERSPSREKSPDKSTTNLKDLDIVTNSIKTTNQETDTNENTLKTENKDITVIDKTVSSSRTKSPTKIPGSKSEKSQTLTKCRSISPKKSSTELTKPATTKAPKSTTTAAMTNKKSTVITKTEKTTSSDKKTVDKQNTTNRNRTVSQTTTKSNVTTKNINKENVSPKKDIEVKVTRTASDTAIKTKKVSPQRMKSKPEIQIRDSSVIKTTKQSYLSVKTQKPTPKQSQNHLPTKPKSATALNNTTEDDDIIIDVEQAKSSRENSPDRICPTPVNVMDDVSTPRLPDEVKEPDDDFRKRTHHTIHETESIVDDIVEISEEDELFIKHTNVSESDECLLSVNDKVSKFLNEIEMVKKPKSTVTDNFMDTEKRTHSDFIDNNLKTDECLLSVSEKVNKFAKGADNIKRGNDQHRIENEYDINTTYQDDYTKLSVNDKAHFFVESAQNTINVKSKPAQKVDRPDLSNVDDELKSDECLLSVSDKVTKFVKTAEQFLNDNYEVEQKEKKIKEQHDEIMRKIVDNVNKETKEDQKHKIEDTALNKTVVDHNDDKLGSFTKETVSSHAKGVEYTSPNLKHAKTPTVKITTLRSSEAVKKAKALFENIASTTTKDTKSTKLTDIGVLKKSPKTDSTIVHHPSIEDTLGDVTDNSKKIKSITRETASSRSHVIHKTEKAQSPTRQSPDISKTKSPIPHETDKKTKPVPLHADVERDVSPKRRDEPKKSLTTKEVPSYQRPTKTSQVKEETNVVEEIEVSTRRGSGKFGVELRRTSMDKSTSVSTERRRSSSDHHQPCIEDIFDLDLLEQMLEKVVGYEQRRRIRSQIRVVKKKIGNESNKTTNPKTKSTHVSTPKTRSPERMKVTNKISTTEHRTSQSKTVSPDRHKTKEQPKPSMNGTTSIKVEKHLRPSSPEKTARLISTRQPSPEKKARTLSPSKTLPSKPKQNRFNEYASAYMKKVGLADEKQTKSNETKTKNVTESNEQSFIKIEQKVIEADKTSTISKSYTERSVSKDKIEIVNGKTQVNGKRSLSPQKTRSPERKPQSPTERLYQRSPSPDFKRTKQDTVKETIIKTVYEVEKKPETPKQEEKPSWITNKNLKKVTSDSRTYSNKKIDTEKSKYRSSSPSKAICKPIDVITSSYGPGPLDADGRPLFGIKALRNGASNYQVKGTVIRSEYHSRNGGEPEGSVSVTAYSTEPEELERLLQVQGDRPSRLHGLAAITTMKKFGGSTGTTLKEAHGKEEQASLEQFTHSDRRVERQTDMSHSMTESRKEERHHQRKTEDNRDSPQKKLDDRLERQKLERTQKIEDRSERLQYLEDRSERSQKVEGRSERLQKVEDRKERLQKVEDRSERSQKVEDRSERLQKLEDRSERTQRKMEERKTVRQSSVKSLTEKYIKSASDTSKSERVTYPKAGLILRTANMRDSISSDSSAHAGLARTDSEHSMGSMDETITRSEHTVTKSEKHDGDFHSTSKTEQRFQKTYSSGKDHKIEKTQANKTEKSKPELRERLSKDSLSSQKVISHDKSGQSTRVEKRQEQSFLDSSSKVTGVQDILTRMKNADIVIEDGDTTEDTEARALLNKFLGATVLMAGMQNYVQEKPSGKITIQNQETVRTSKSASQPSRASSTTTQSKDIQNVDLEQCWDERELRKLLDSCTDYEQRRRIRARIRALMAEQEACAAAVTAALEAADGDAREEEEVTTVTSSVRRNSTEKTVSSSSSTTTTTSKVIESMTKPAPKPVSPFAKFRQLEKQNSVNSPNSPKSPVSPGSPSQPYFKFTDPALQLSAVTIKERLLQWCRDKTRDYENVKLENFSTSWADGLAFCALVHRFLPQTFDYSKLSPQNRRHNFTLAFKVADEKAGIYPLLDVDDMVAMRKPDWKCVFTYVQSIHRRFKDED